MTINPIFLKDLTTIGTALAAAFLAALWLSLIFWTFRDIRQRSRDPLLRILAVLIVTVLYLPGIIIYFILRPATTLDEEYQRLLEEEALLQTVEENARCPGCGRQTEKGWMVCPNCHTRLKKQCVNCKQLMEIPWDLCPYCGTPTPGARREDLSLDEVMNRMTDRTPQGEGDRENQENAH
jgi:RNA polymerase subunit RPABC4/transcription elongation factor Spt4